MMQTDYPTFLSHHQYAIVDCAHLFPQPWTESAPMMPLIPNDMRGDAEDMPALLPLDDPGAPWMLDLLGDLTRCERFDSRPPIVNLIAVPKGTDPKALSRHLKERLVVHFPEGKAYLKYFLPDTFVHLKRILPPALLQALYGPVSSWTVYFQKQWVSEPTPGITENVPVFWDVTAEQYAALERIQLVNRVLSFWREDRDRPWASLAEFRAYANHADDAVICEQRAQPEARDSAIVSTIRRQFPKNFSFRLQDFQ